MRKVWGLALYLNRRTHLMLKIDFLKYSVKDFLLDESFQQWVIQPHKPPVTAWPDWLKEHPEKNIKVNKARAMMEQLKAGLTEDVSHEDRKEVWLKINNSVNDTDFRPTGDADD